MGSSSSKSLNERDFDFPSSPRTPFRLPWKAYQGNAFVDHEKLAELLQATWQLDQSEAGAWEEDEVEALARLVDQGAALPSSAIARLWRGVPDAEKSLVWSLASGALKDGKNEAKARYHSDLLRAFGEHVPETFERCPTFWGAVSASVEGANSVSSGGSSGSGAGCQSLEARVPFFHLLRPDGVTLARKLLWTCSQVNPSIELCPVLPVMICLLTVFCDSEESVYAIVAAVISRAAKDQQCLERGGDSPSSTLAPPLPFLPFNKRQWTSLATRAVRLAETEMPAEVAHLHELGIDLLDVAAHYLLDGLASLLPFRALCRVYGVFLAQGCEVFVRQLVALWVHRRDFLMKCTSLEVARELLMPPDKSAILHQARGKGGRLGIDDLARLALELRIPPSLARVQTEDAPRCLQDTLRPSLEEGDLLFCRPRLHDKTSRFIWDALWPYLWLWLPPIFRVRDPKLFYASYTDGYSLSALLDACTLHAPEDMPMLLALQVRRSGSFTAGASQPAEADANKADTQAVGQTFVIGGFFPIPLKYTGGGYFDLASLPALGTDVTSSYIFRVMGGELSHGKPQVWYWTGKNSMLYCATGNRGSYSHEFLVGGECPAFGLDQDLARGTSRSCASYGSPPLLCANEAPAGEQAEDEAGQTTDSVDYEIVAVEVFTLD
eukprot:TRINITY_DN44917_c0_g1_i2.p1 TRINITY_DN44917_c0_g1~~TRINITY_DN44917_c0_g1_i2.p1  ORF type:complete len:665 (-),score=87.20 TRINITY_DN44917_c0_g1_i2:60-2054(-)